jgi:misacylated tRNA(Ala) deacylase
VQKAVTNSKNADKTVETTYLTDSYQKEIHSKVTATSSNLVELDRTIFYPTGGGQPSDTGVIALNGTKYSVLEASKNKENGSVLHILDRETQLKEGDQVHCTVDWEKRYMHMRLHTAMHVIDGIAKINYRADLKGGGIKENGTAAILYYDFGVIKFDEQRARKIIEKAQDIVDKNLKIIARTLEPSVAANLYRGLARTETGSEILKTLETVRVVEIEGFDAQMDGGTHVATTKEIGKLEFVETQNKGAARKGIKFTLRQ